MAQTERQQVTSVECIGETEEYVYDISMKEQDPYFFANGILVHNTDSCYFSAWPAVKAAVAAGDMEWNKDTAIALYDQIGDQVSDSFPSFMKRAFNCPKSFGEIVKCGREVVAESGIFIKKKRYALLVIDDEGKRVDVGGKPGKIKAMGLDLKRSDTPDYMQEFLKEILEDCLVGKDPESIAEKIRDFKVNFKSKPSWHKGTPKRVNNLTKFTNQVNSGKKGTVPGHVRAAINWNMLRRMNADNYSMPIMDGQKTIVCKLKPNPIGLTSIAYPIDEPHLPSWFKELPFDDAAMLTAIVDQKVDNLLGVLNWGLRELTDTASTFDSLFDF
jgi:hypothetical protein